MIVSVSRRTDVPAYLSPWFFSRLREGFVEVAGPYNPRRFRRVSLLPEDVDGFVFWTKNPLPMIDSLGLLDGYGYYFLFTLNPYGDDIECGLPPKRDLIGAFKTLSNILGAARVVWRYDPVLLNGSIDVAFHAAAFEALAAELAGHTRKVIFSFIDGYKKIEKPLENLQISAPDAEQKAVIAETFSTIARGAGLEIASCAEDMDLSRYGILPSRCIDPALLEASGGKPVPYKKDRNQRPFCLCAGSVDIGAYRSCRGGCVYCYAK
jgi:hypothetical protein